LLLVYSNTIVTGEGPGSIIEKIVDNTKVLVHIYGTGNQQSNIVFRDLQCRGHLSRWSAIYSVGENSPKADDSGGRLVVTGNLVSAPEQLLDQGGATLRSGITISSAREAVIRGNVVIDQPSANMPGIRCSPQWWGGDYLVTGNIVKNVQGPEIFMSRGLGNSVISDNTLVECGAVPGWAAIHLWYPTAPVSVKGVAISSGNSSLAATKHGHLVGDRVRIINGANHVRSDLTNDTIFYLRDDMPPPTDSFEVTLAPGTPVPPSGFSPTDATLGYYQRRRLGLSRPER
jgi:hypothetical protein